ncbi:MAG: methyltransferase domain-containing protein [Rhodocyclaceae bacterium]|nr:methyltransferase domain-containing protein [Rhodocyclaceae bacterium]
MSYANSRIPSSAQAGVHEHLARAVERHAAAPFRKPYATYNEHAVERALEGWDGRAPLILDAGCGVAHSTIQIARANPDARVIGVDQSEDRLSRRKPYPEALLPGKMLLVRADLVDFWRLLVDRGIRLHAHYILYPNPWPKIGHLGRRWHAHPVFPFVPRLGGRLEMRTNWQVYGEEFALALGLLTGRSVSCESYEAETPLTPFERKYRDSGQALYRVSLDLGDVRLDGPAEAVHASAGIQRESQR